MKHKQYYNPDKPIQLHLTETMKKWLFEKAERENETVSVIVMRMIMKEWEKENS